MVYFAADTGFGPHFGWIRDRFGPPRAALLPIGAYEPRWFMSPVHMDPEEALAAHRIWARRPASPSTTAPFSSPMRPSMSRRGASALAARPSRFSYWTTAGMPC